MIKTFPTLEVNLMTLTEHFDMKQNSQTFHVGYFWFCSYKHFQFLLLNMCPRKRIFICKKTKEIITVTLSAFAIFVKVVICI